MPPSKPPRDRKYRSAVHVISEESTEKTGNEAGITLSGLTDRFT